ncbi:Serine protease AprX [BD1-7 clade bacterium]|uniref:Serine protease AprX n=1 Tax=BD1-7 clade bacterium TaxID=2029982 RepID=A0A5S9N9D1_9GAMM|nr:Serine protease AprX [BD1-7 clade bacterium]CAA0085600.1 Serine protease AprX [BD1-7 clade bacterium]
MKNNSITRSLIVFFGSFGVSSLSLHASAQVPESVERLLSAPSFARAVGGQSQTAQPKQPLVYVSLKGEELARLKALSAQRPELEISAHQRNGVTTFILSPNAITALAALQQQDAVTWLETTFPGVLNIGLISAGGEEPMTETDSLVPMHDEDIPLSFPEAQWMGLSAFWQGLNIQGRAMNVGVLDSGFKSIVPDEFDPFPRKNYVSKYRIHGAFTAANNGEDKPLNHRSSSAELNNPYYGDRNNGSEKKQYHIVGLRSGHGTQTSCAATGGYVNDEANGISAVPRGASYAARLVFDFAGDETVQIDPATGEYVDKTVALKTTMDSLAWISRQGIDMLNYSFGHGEQYAQAWIGGTYQPEQMVSPYSTIAREFDRAAYLNDFLFFKSAGNRSVTGDPYAFTLTEPADTYNGIVVGNMNPYYVEDADDDLTVRKPRSAHHLRVASARGPTLDGRRKPDIVAPGSYVVSCTVPYIDNEREDYRAVAEARPVTGTSIAAPLAEGVAGLVKEAVLTQDASSWNLSDQAPRFSMAVKAILINSADNRMPTKYEASRQEGALGKEATIWPDPTNAQWNNGYGFGYISAAQAAKEYDHVIQDAVGIGEVKYYQVVHKNADPADIKVTLTWEKRYPSNHEHKLYDYGYPLTPLRITLTQGNAKRGQIWQMEDTSLIAKTMTQHKIGRTVYDYSSNPWDTRQQTYTPYNNVLQVKGADNKHIKSSCIEVSVVPDQVKRIVGTKTELYALASNVVLTPVESCSVEAAYRPYQAVDSQAGLTNR